MSVRVLRVFWRWVRNTLSSLGALWVGIRSMILFFILESIIYEWDPETSSG